jgi:hypothetical protein
MDTHAQASTSLPSSQGSESMPYYDDSCYPTQISSASTSTDTNPAQWEQDDSLYASALDNTASQLTAAAPFSDFLGFTNGLPITPLSQMFFEQERRSASPEESQQGSFVASIEPPPYWAETRQEAFDTSSGWSMSTDEM